MGTPHFFPRSRFALRLLALRSRRTPLPPLSTPATQATVNSTSDRLRVGASVACRSLPADVTYILPSKQNFISKQEYSATFIFSQIV